MNEPTGRIWAKRVAPHGCTARLLGGVDGLCGRDVSRDGLCQYHFTEQARRPWSPPPAKTETPKRKRFFGAKMTMVTFMLDPELVAEGKRIAAERGESFSSVIREAVQRGMRRMAA